MEVRTGEETSSPLVLARATTAQSSAQGVRRRSPLHDSASNPRHPLARTSHCPAPPLFRSIPTRPTHCCAPPCHNTMQYDRVRSRPASFARYQPARYRLCPIHSQAANFAQMGSLAAHRPTRVPANDQDRLGRLHPPSRRPRRAHLDAGNLRLPDTKIDGRACLWRLQPRGSWPVSSTTRSIRGDPRQDARLPPHRSTAFLASHPGAGRTARCEDS